jgi:hypothetical protein
LQLRVTITAANTEEEVDAYLLAGFAKVREWLDAQGAPLAPSMAA